MIILHYILVFSLLISPSDNRNLRNYRHQTDRVRDDASSIARAITKEKQHRCNFNRVRNAKLLVLYQQILRVQNYCISHLTEALNPVLYILLCSVAEIGVMTSSTR